MSWNYDYNKEHRLVAFDVDSCLITYNDLPNYSVIGLYRSLQKLGCTMVVWSGGGEEYAKHWAEKLGLFPDIVACKFDNKLEPDIAFDDEKIQLGKVNILV